MHQRIMIRQRVETGVVTEGSLQYQRLRRVDIPFEHQLGLGGYFEAAGHCAGKIDRFSSQESSKEKFIDGGWQPSRAGVDARWISAQTDDHGHALASRCHFPPMAGSDLVPLPVPGERV